MKKQRQLVSAIEPDGERQINGNSITLQDDGQVHKVWVVYWVNKCWSGIFIVFFADSILSIGDNTDEEVWWLVMDLYVNQFFYF
jgi:transposase-like protein